MLQDVVESFGGVEVSPMEVYRDIFRLGEGELQNKCEAPGEFKANPIAYWKNNGDASGHFRIMFDDTFEDTLRELQQADFAILNGVTYFGRRNVQEHASKMYAMIFDIDGVTDKELKNLIYGMFVDDFDVYPLANYVVLSGHGVHLYYVFEEPIPLFPNIKLQLKELKYELTKRLWNMHTSAEKKQYQGINQGFRVIGGKTKTGSHYATTKAFRLNSHPVSLAYLNCYVSENKIDESKRFRESKMTLAEAKKKYSKWYEKVVVNGDRTVTKWDISGKVHGKNPYALYDWWKQKIENGATFGHRYFSVMCLAIYAAKCDVPEERLREDAEFFIPRLNEINPDEPFTKEDVESALECFDDRYCTFPIKDIEKLSGIKIERNKRKGRTQAAHIRRITLLRDNDYPDGSWRNTNGRPKGASKEKKIVEEWQQANPGGKKASCMRETGLSKSTVYRWWK